MKRNHKTINRTLNNVKAPYYNIEALPAVGVVVPGGGAAKSASGSASASKAAFSVVSTKYPSTPLAASITKFEATLAKFLLFGAGSSSPFYWSKHPLPLSLAESLHLAPPASFLASSVSMVAFSALQASPKAATAVDIKVFILA